MRHLRRLGNIFEISIPPDENGYVGRECPECEQYFKITLGTGITDGEPPCNCPYCGHCSGQDQFFTQAQIEYAQSVAINKVTTAFIKDLKSLEFNHRPKGPFGIGISMKVEGRPEPICHYSELQLEEEVICDNCTLRYTIYGIFAYCPDCGRHNSRQILDKNLALAQKQIALASQVEADLAAHLISDALENGVSAFDGFGRETCKVHASKATDPPKAEKISFQNISGAQKNVQQLFGIDLASGLDATEWTNACRSFQKRHLLAHKMGIVDEAYVKATADPSAVVGRKVSIQTTEVEALLDCIRRLGSHLTAELEKKP
ncbi:hypothetical protein Pla8534_18830 [Lignipirellula cremea]|uniref:Uncharacterized protein n=2 Tax=Lignipirellula cremea TaxID=2528010 RepID=A0A518DQH9_9BACT|nr:hypothetical protein Pla8534_18830 [Lignipirellula cremea]